MHYVHFTYSISCGTTASHVGKDSLLPFPSLPQPTATHKNMDKTPNGLDNSDSLPHMVMTGLAAI